ncbi:small multidrug export protein [hydrocarbon metagenome]|uniref:Small multidrug export protein n=1 Tax=hydrocarbon metagenome TaxID=938273 RepID=A0A0W8E1F2_9ZZZZ
MEAIFKQLFSFLTIELTVLLTAMLPVIEVRGAIPVGISMGLSPLNAAFISVVGSMIPVPIVFFTVRPVFNYLKGTRLFKNAVNRIIKRSMGKSGNVQKYGAWGLVLFVAIPLPGTGVWTGAIIAALLDIRFKRVFAAILLGDVIAAVAIMLLSSGIVRAVS